MKKFNKLLCCLFMTLAVVVFLPEETNAASVSVSGPGTVRPGDTITVSVSTSGAKMEGIQLKVTYSSSVLTYSSFSKTMPNPWQTSIEKNSDTINVVTIDYDMTSPKNSATVCKLKFKVKGAKGESISVKVSGTVSNINGKTETLSGGSYSKTIAAPLSSNADLKSLSVSNASISPKFNSNTTNYKASVAYSVSSLNINAKASDSGASVKIKNNSLKAGGTTSVNVVVTAPDGTQKTYSISIKREQDPNYKASETNTLSKLSVDKGILSPVFDKEKTNYIVYLPYEITSLKVTATPTDDKATVASYGGSDLIVGENLMGVICTSESGKENEYKIKVIRAESYEAIENSGADVENILNEFTKISKGDQSENSTVVLDLSESQSKQVPKEVFLKLKELDNTTLIILLGNGRVLFESKDITGNVDKDFYDFSLSFYSEYESLIKEKSGISDGIIYSIGEETSLPGYGTFVLNTSFIKDTNVNIYKYNLAEEKFYLISEGVTVLDGGVLVYKNNSCSEYIITENTISTAIRSDAADIQVEGSSFKDLSLFGVSFNLIHAICLVGTLVIGIICGYIISKLGKKRNSYNITKSKSKTKINKQKSEIKQKLEKGNKEIAKEKNKKKLRKYSDRKVEENT